MSRAHRLAGCLLIASLTWLGSKKDEHDPEAHGEGLGETPALEVQAPSGDYKLTASDMPLTEDFRKAATKLVTPDNYREQISRVERELAQLAESEERARRAAHDGE